MLVELKQAAVVSHQSTASPQPSALSPDLAVRRFTVGDLELISLCDGLFRLDGGAMFGVVPKVLWEKRAPADERNRITLAMRPLIVRGARTMLIDAGLGDKENAKFHDIYGVDRAAHPRSTRWPRPASRRRTSTSCSPRTCTSITPAASPSATPTARVRPRFPRAQYVVRRGEWEDATHPHERNRASYLADNYVPLADGRRARSWSTTTRRSCRA